MTSATCRNVYFSSIHAHSCVGHHEVRAMDPEPVPTYFECFKAIYFAAIKFFTAEGQQLSLQHFHKAFVEYCSISQNDVLVILGLAVFLTLLRFLLSKLVFTVSVQCSNTLSQWMFASIGYMCVLYFQVIVTMMTQGSGLVDLWITITSICWQCCHFIINDSLTQDWHCFESHSNFMSVYEATCVLCGTRAYKAIQDFTNHVRV